MLEIPQIWDFSSIQNKLFEWLIRLRLTNLDVAFIYIIILLLVNKKRKETIFTINAAKYFTYGKLQ